MKTPYGQECHYYYQDFHRGKSQQECRLILANAKSAPWRPELCKTCPVPGILRANACSNMVLEGQVSNRWFGLQRQITVYAVCKLEMVEVAEPHVGCGKCHEHRPGAVILESHQ